MAASSDSRPEMAWRTSPGADRVEDVDRGLEVRREPWGGVSVATLRPAPFPEPPRDVDDDLPGLDRSVAFRARSADRAGREAGDRGVGRAGGRGLRSAGQDRPGQEHDDGDHGLPPLLVRATVGPALEHGRVALDRRLHDRRLNVLPTGDDRRRGPAGDDDLPTRLDPA